MHYVAHRRDEHSLRDSLSASLSDGHLALIVGSHTCCTLQRSAKNDGIDTASILQEWSFSLSFHFCRSFKLCSDDTSFPLTITTIDATTTSLPPSHLYHHHYSIYNCCCPMPTSTRASAESGGKQAISDATQAQMMTASFGSKVCFFLIVSHFYPLTNCIVSLFSIYPTGNNGC